MSFFKEVLAEAILTCGSWARFSRRLKDLTGPKKRLEDKLGENQSNLSLPKKITSKFRKIPRKLSAIEPTIDNFLLNETKF